MLKVGIIGVGAMGTQHFLRLMKKISGATVTAVSDVNEAHAKEVIAPYPRWMQLSLSAQTRPMRSSVWRRCA